MSKVFQPKISFHESTTGSMSSITIDDKTLSQIASPGNVELKFDYDNDNDVDSEGNVIYSNRDSVLKEIGDLTNFDMFFRRPVIIYPKYNFLREINMFQASPFEVVEPGCVHFKTKWEIASDGDFSSDLESIEVVSGDLTKLNKIFTYEKEMYVRVTYYGRTSSGSEHELTSNIRCFTTKDQVLSDYNDLVNLVRNKNITFGLCSLPKLAVNLGWIQTEDQYDAITKERFYNLFGEPVESSGSMTGILSGSTSAGRKNLNIECEWTNDGSGLFSYGYNLFRLRDVGSSGDLNYGTGLPNATSPRFSNVEGVFYIGVLRTEIDLFKRYSWNYTNIENQWFSRDWAFIYKIGSSNSSDNFNFFSTKLDSRWYTALLSNEPLDSNLQLSVGWRNTWFKLKYIDKSKYSCDVKINNKLISPEDFSCKDSVEFDVVFSGDVDGISVELPSVYYNCEISESQKPQVVGKKSFILTLRPKEFDTGVSSLGRGFINNVLESSILTVKLSTKNGEKIFKFSVKIGDKTEYDLSYDKTGLVVKYDDGGVKYKLVPVVYKPGSEIGTIGCPKVAKNYEIVGFIGKITRDSRVLSGELNPIYAISSVEICYGRKLSVNDVGIVDLVDPGDISSVVFFRPFDSALRNLHLDATSHLNGNIGKNTSINKYVLNVNYLMQIYAQRGDFEFGVPFQYGYYISMVLKSQNVNFWVKKIETLNSSSGSRQVQYACDLNSAPTTNNISTGTGSDSDGYEFLLKTVENFDDKISIECDVVHYCDECREYHIVKSNNGYSLSPTTSSYKPSVVEIIDGEANDTEAKSQYSNPVNCKPLLGELNLTLGKDSSSDPEFEVINGAPEDTPGMSTMSTASIRWVNKEGNLSGGFNSVYSTYKDVFCGGQDFEFTSRKSLIDGSWMEIVNPVSSSDRTGTRYSGAIINGKKVKSFKWKRERFSVVTGESPYTEVPVSSFTLSNIIAKSAMKEFGVSSLGTFHMDFYDFFRFLKGNDGGYYWLDFKDFITSNAFIQNDNVGATSDISLSIQHYGQFGFERIIGDYVETSSGFHVKMDYTETSSGPTRNIFDSDLSCGDMVMGMYTNIYGERDFDTTLRQDGFVLYKSGGTINQELISKIKLKYPSFISLGSERSFSYVAGKNILTSGQFRVEPNGEIYNGCLGAVFPRGAFRFYRYDKNRTLKKSAYHKLLSSRNNKPEQLIPAITNSGTWDDYVGMQWRSVIRDKMIGMGFNNNCGNNRFMGLWSMDSSDFMKLLGCSSYETLLRYLPNYQPPGNDYLGGHKFLNGGYEVKRVLITCNVGSGVVETGRLECYYVDMNDNVLYRSLGSVGNSSGGGTLVSVSAVDKISDAQEDLYFYKNTVKSSFVWYSKYDRVTNVDIDTSFLQQIKSTYPTFKWCSYDQSLDLDYMSGTDMVVLDVKFDTPKVVTAQTLRLFSNTFSPRTISENLIKTPHAPRHDSPLLRTVSDGLRRISKYVEASSYFANFTVEKMAGFAMSGKFFFENILGTTYNASFFASQLSDYINSEWDDSSLFSPSRTSVTWAYNDMMYGWSPQILMLDKSRSSQYSLSDTEAITDLTEKRCILQRISPSYSSGTNDGIPYYPAWGGFYGAPSFVCGLRVDFVRSSISSSYIPNPSTFIVYSPVTCSRTNIAGFVNGRPSEDDLLRLPLRNERIHYLVGDEYVKLLHQSEPSGGLVGSQYYPMSYQVTWYGK